MILNARGLTAFQLCRRRWLLEQSWKVRRWRGKALFDRCLRDAIRALSDGDDPAATITIAKAQFMSAAADPGLDTTAAPYQLASDLAAMLATVLTAASRLSLLKLHRPDVVRLAPGVEWQPTALADDSGMLHRWITVDAWDRDAQARECHSWYALGDMLACDVPLQLHVVVIGSMRDGRRVSPWCRAFQHPVIADKLRFQRPSSKGGYRALSGDKWLPVWLADRPRMAAAAWCDLMDADGVTPSLLLHPAIAQPADAARSQLLAEVVEEAWRMDEERLRADRKGAATVSAAGPKFPATTPGSRANCDGLVPCPWQAACWRSEFQVPVEALGPYVALRRDLPSAGSGASERSSHPPKVAS